MKTAAMIGSASPAVRRANSSTISVPTTPLTTSPVVNCAPARKSNPSSSIAT